MLLTDGALREGEEEVGGLREAVSSCQTSRGNERGEAQYIIRPLMPSFSSFLCVVEGFSRFLSIFPPSLPLHTRTLHANPAVEGFNLIAV